MSLLILGLSHRSAPIPVLEQAARITAVQTDVAERLLASEHIDEVAVLATCNRVELYAEVPLFHAGLRVLGETLAAVASTSVDSLRPYVYVHHEDAAVRHLFSVACGLDSLAVGEPQILGQLRDATERAQGLGHLGPHLGAALQQALHVGKRVHAETNIDEVSRSLVELALATVAERVGSLTSLRTVVVGAGAMSGLAAATARRFGIDDLTVVNRTPSAGVALAERYDACARPWTELTEAVAKADLVIACTGAPTPVLDRAVLAQAAALRTSTNPWTFVDLAVPRDVDPAAASEVDAYVVNMESLTRPAGTCVEADTAEFVDGVLVGAGDVPYAARRAEPMSSDPRLAAAYELVTCEVAKYRESRAMAQVAPAVSALHGRGHEVVQRELDRLCRRVDLDPSVVAEVERALQRTVDKLLHTPTVQMRRLAGEGDVTEYVSLLGDLFDLDPEGIAGGAA